MMDNIKSRILRISDFLKDENVIFFPAGLSKQQIFEKLIATLKLPDAGLALKAILDRELWGSTVIAPGLALPHARIPGITRIAAALGIGSKEKSPQIVLLFLGPLNNPQEHLAFLASVSALFQTTGFLDTLAQLTTPEAVLTKIRDLEN
jgi:PTS system nitrogen regulatory IIA component